LGQLLGETTVLRCVAGRIGGEEFAVILAGSDLGTTRLFAEAVRAGFAAADLGGDVPWTVTVSAGIAQRRQHESLQGLIARADKALYAAKANGRNRVMLADDAPARRVRFG
jgi:diguanylate cyclase (GGDEF)-like protein